MISEALAWDIVQRQLGGPGAQDRDAITPALREEIFQRIHSVVADMAYWAQHQGQRGMLSLYQPQRPGSERVLVHRMASMLAFDLNLENSPASEDLLERACQELIDLARRDCVGRGDWGHICTDTANLTVFIAPTQHHTPGTHFA
jgi:hypothetical protein